MQKYIYIYSSRNNKKNTLKAIPRAEYIPFHVLKHVNALSARGLEKNCSQAALQSRCERSLQEFQRRGDKLMRYTLEKDLKKWRGEAGKVPTKEHGRTQVW